MNELSTVSAKWKKLGEQLGVEHHRLEDIRIQYSDPADGMRELIKQWLKQGYHLYSAKGLTTWNHIVHALKSPNVGESQLGDNLKQKYLPGELFDIFTIACFGSDSGDLSDGIVLPNCWSYYSDIMLMRLLGRQIAMAHPLLGRAVVIWGNVRITGKKLLTPTDASSNWIPIIHTIPRLYNTVFSSERSQQESITSYHFHYRATIVVLLSKL